MGRPHARANRADRPEVRKAAKPAKRTSMKEHRSPEMVLYEKCNMGPDEHPGRDPLTYVLVGLLVAVIAVLIGCGVVLHKSAEAEERDPAYVQEAKMPESYRDRPDDGLDRPSPDGEEPQHVARFEGDFYTQGAYEDERGWKFTWYSEKVLPGGGLEALNANGRHTDEDGYVRDGDGYLCVAMPIEVWDSYKIGDAVETPFGKARIYDWNPDGTWDLYVNWT